MKDNINNQPMYKSWGSQKEKDKLLNDISLFESDVGVFRRKAAASRSMEYKNIDNNINVRPSFTRDNYEYFRPEEDTPKRRNEILSLCSVAAQKIGLIKNVLDLMGDFTTEGIDIIHKEPMAQKVIKAWANKIGLINRCERFANLLYRLGTVGIVKQNATLTRIDIKNIQQFINEESITIDETRPSFDIPIKYNFLHPSTISVIGGDLALFGTDKPKYGLSIPTPLKKKILSPSSMEEKTIINSLPNEVLLAAKNSKPIKLDDNFSIFFYKKDDWEQFPKPMIYAILDDVMMLEKLKLTDLAACDSVISSVRLWTLGSLEHKILPTPAAIAKLSEILSNNVGGGCYDFVWDATLSFKESTSDVSKYLGEEKYKPTLKRIYEGLGVPSSLTADGNTGGFTNNYISLKTLTKRLEYGRSVLLDFLNTELSIVQKSLGLKEPFQVVFDKMVLSDENAEKQLLIQLLDRNIISDETILDRFGEYYDIEKSRVNNETKQRKEKKMPKKAGQFYSPQREEEMKKAFIQTGQVTPSQLGLELDPKKPGEKTPLDIKGSVPMEKIKGKSGQGRPKGKKDSSKRKQKQVNIKTSASFVDISMWAKESQETINSLIMPYLLKHYNKVTARAFTDKQLLDSEKIKFNILSQIEPFTNINIDLVLAAMESPSNIEISVVYNNLVDGYITRNGKEPTIDYLRQLQVYAYSIYYQGDDKNG